MIFVILSIIAIINIRNNSVDIIVIYLFIVIITTVIVISIL